MEENACALQGEISSEQQSNSLFRRQEVSGAIGTTLSQEVHKVTPAHKGKPNHGSCYRCGKAEHKADKCKFRDAQCYACGKTGHIKTACRSAQKSSSKVKSAPHSVRVVQEEEVVNYPLFYLGTASNSPPITVSVAVEKCPVTMEVNTGAALSLQPLTSLARQVSITLKCLTMFILWGSKFSHWQHGCDRGVQKPSSSSTPDCCVGETGCNIYGWIDERSTTCKITR